MTSIFPVVLAGGSGTRLWPLSRTNFPKQFLHLQGQSSLLQKTMSRVSMLTQKPTTIICNETHYFHCHEQLATFNTPIHYLLEPCSRNTAPAIASAAHYLSHQYGPDALMLILPADHSIDNDHIWYDAMLKGAHYAETHPTIMTFGIKPTEPKTGYGYIEAGISLSNSIVVANAFHEKPNRHLAQEFIAHGNHYWNSGMFICRAEIYLNELARYEPKMYEHSHMALSKASHYQDYTRLDLEAFSECKAQSIDYAIMEKTDQATLLPVDMIWSDLGCWSSVAEANGLDEQGNTLHGNVLAHHTENCLIHSEGTLITTIGIRDQIVVVTPDAVLVADKEYSQQVKDIVGQLAQNQAQVVHDHRRVLRPWGYYEILAEGSTFKVKRLMVKPGAKLSLQLHQSRAEHWVVVSGKALVINDDKQMVLGVNESTYIPKKTKHRLINHGSDPLYVIEVQSGDYLGEDDIIRFDDDYSLQTTSSLYP